MTAAADTDPIVGRPAAVAQGPIFLLCFAVALLDGFDTQVLPLCVPLLASHFGVGPAAFTSVFVAQAVGAIIGSLAAGYAADRIGVRATLIVSIILFALFTLAVPFATSLEALAAIRFLSGIGAAGCLTAIVTLCISIGAASGRVRKTMLAYTGVPGGFIVASLLASALVDTSYWWGLFAIGGVIPLVIIPLLLRYLPGREDMRRLAAEADRPLAQGGPAEVPADARREGLLSRAHGPKTGLLWITMLIASSAVYLIIAWLPTSLNMAGYSSSLAALSSSFIYVGSVIGTLLFAAVIERGKPDRVLILGYALAVAAALAIPVLLSPAPLAAIGALVVLGVTCLGAQVTLNVFSASLYPEHLRGRGTGWALGFNKAGALAGPLIGGIVIGGQDPVGRVFPAIAAFMLVNMVMIALLARFMPARAARD